MITKYGKVVIYPENYVVRGHNCRIEIVGFADDGREAGDEQNLKMAALQWAKQRIEDEINSLAFSEPTT